MLTVSSRDVIEHRGYQLTYSQSVIPEFLGIGGGGGGGRGGARGRGGFGGPSRGGAPGGGGAGLQSLTPQEVRKLNGILRNAKFTVTHR